MSIFEEYGAFNIKIFNRNPCFNANSVDPDQTASDLGLHCFANALFVGR